MTDVSRRTFLAALTGSAAFCADAAAMAGPATGARRYRRPDIESWAQGEISIFEVLDPAARRAVLRNDYSEIAGVSKFVQLAVDMAQGRTLTFGTGVFRLEAPVRLADTCYLDLGTSTLQIVGDTLGFVGVPVPPIHQLMVLKGAELGSRALEVNSTEGVQVGQWGFLRGDSPEGNRNSWPPGWGRIEEVSANTIVFDRSLPVDYRGVCELVVVPAMTRRFSLRNGVVDGSLNQHDRATGQAVRVTGYESVTIEDVEFARFNYGGIRTSAVEVYECVDVAIRHCSFKDGISGTNMVDVQTARDVEFRGNLIVGDHFGVNITRADYGKAIGNTVIGRRKKNADASDGAVRSVRGIKFYGCGHALISNNHCADYESPIKVQACMRFLVEGNYVLNSGLDRMTGQIALNVGSQYRGSDMHSGIVTGNIVENCGGTGIGVTSDAIGQVIIANNVVRRCGAHAIYLNVDNCIVTGNQVTDWDLLREGYAGIGAKTEGRHIIKDNLFHNGSSPDAACIGIRGKGSIVSDNLCTTGNAIVAAPTL